MAEISASQANETASTSLTAAEDLFNFDINFLKKMPELRSDFSTPPLFTSWGAADRQTGPGHSWHMLSLGASRTGLPFHVHGETWLGLVFGKKRWFLFAPGR